MASYLRPTDPSVFQTIPFQPPFAILGRAASYLQGKYINNVSAIQDQYSSALNLQVSNNQVKEKVNAYTEGIKRNLDNIGTVDFSIDDNRNQALRIFEPLYSDQDVLYDMGQTKFARSEQERALTLRDNKDGGAKYWSETNYTDFVNSFNDFKNADISTMRSKQIRPYTPYFDYKDDITKKFKDLNATVEQDVLTGNYIVKTKNGPLAYDSYESFVRAFTGQQGIDQMNIEARVNYRKAAEVTAFERGIPLEQAQYQLGAEYYDKYITSIDEQIVEANKEQEAINDKIKAKELIPKDQRNAFDSQDLATLEVQKKAKQSRIENLNSLRSSLTMKSGVDEVKFKSQAGETLYNKLYKDAIFQGISRGLANSTYSQTMKADEFALKQLDFDLERLKASLKEGKEGSEKKTPGPVVPEYVGEADQPEIQENMFEHVTKTLVGTLEQKKQAVNSVGDNIFSSSGRTDVMSSIDALDGSASLYGAQRADLIGPVSSIIGKDASKMTIKDIKNELLNKVDAYLKEGNNLSGNPQLNEAHAAIKSLDVQIGVLQNVVDDVKANYKAAGVALDEDFQAIVGDKFTNSKGEFISFDEFVKMVGNSSNEVIKKYTYPGRRPVAAIVNGRQVSGDEIDLRDLGEGWLRKAMNTEKLKELYDKNRKESLRNFNTFAQQELGERGMKFGAFRFTAGPQTKEYIEENAQVRKVAGEVVRNARQNPFGYLTSESREFSENQEFLSFLESASTEEAVTNVVFSQMSKGNNYYRINFDAAKLRTLAGKNGNTQRFEEEINKVAAFGLEVTNVPVQASPKSEDVSLLYNSLRNGRTVSLDLSGKAGNTTLPFKYTIKQLKDISTGQPYIQMDYTYPIFDEDAGKLQYDPESKFYKWREYSNTIRIESVEDAIQQANKILAAERAKWGQYMSNKAMSKIATTRAELERIISQ